MKNSFKRTAKVIWTLVYLPFCLISALAIAQETEEEPGVDSEPVEQWQPFSIATKYNAFMLEGFEAHSADIQGRLAAGGDIRLSSYSVASELETAPEDLTLVSGADIYFENGRLFTGSMAATGSVDNVMPPVIDGLQEGAQASGEQELPFSFRDEFDLLESYSTQLSELEATGTVEYKWGGAYLKGDCDSDFQVFNLDGHAIYNSHTFAVECVPAEATIVFNLSGLEPGFTNVSLYHLNSNAHNIVYNFYEAEVVHFSNIAVEGSVLAPKAHFSTSWGHVNGTVIGQSWSGPMELHHVPFTGNLDFLRPPPRFVSEPVLSVSEGELYEYPVLVENTYGPFTLTFIGEPPAGLSIDDETNTLLWQTDYDSAGQHEVTLSIAGWEAVTQTFTIDVLNVNRAPVVEVIQAVESNEADLVSIQVSATDPDQDPLSYSLSDTAPEGMSIDANGLITWQTTYSDAGTYQLHIYVSDGIATVERTFNLSISNTNRAPVITSQPVINAQATIDYTYTITVEDPDGDAVNLNLSNKPAAMSLSPEGVIYWTPTLNDVGQQPVTVVASDGDLATEQAFEVAVASINLPPEFTSTPVSEAVENSLYTYTLQAQDPNLEDVLSFEINEAPEQMAMIGNQLQWTPGFEDAGTHNIQVVVSDGEYTDVQTFTVNVTNTNRRPEFVSTPVTGVQATKAYQYALEVIDPDGDEVSLSLDEFPSGMSINEAGVILWNPSLSDVGEAEVKVTASDGDLIAAQTFVVIVDSINLPPVFTSIPILTAKEASAYSYFLTAEDPNEDALLSFDIVSSPPGMSLDSATLNWLPGYDQGGAHNVVVSVTDGEFVAEQSFSITVSETEQPVAPVITSTPVLEVEIDSPYIYQVSASDANTGDVLIYTLSQSPEEMSIDPASGIISWVASDISEGDYAVTVVVTDSTGLSDTQAYSIHAYRANQSPVITSTPAEEVNSGQTYIYDVDATDPDGDSLAYSLVVPPVGMSIDEETGIIQWQESEPGIYPVTVAVFDGNGGSASQSFMVSIIHVNSAPVITSEPVVTAEVGVAYQYSVSATDAENDILTYQLVSPPEGMTINDVSGVITWTPMVDQLPTQNVLVRVADPDGEFDEQTYEVAINAANEPPVITSFPVHEVNEGAAYTYSVTATDPEGGELVYSLENAPSGMSIDSATGVISWVGSHAWANSNLKPNQYCELPATDRTELPEAMDAVMLMDGSGSNDPFWPMVSDALAQLNAEAMLVGIGRGEHPNLFGVSGFERPHTFENGSLMSSVSDAFNRVWRGRDSHGSEYANRALEETIRSYPFRAELPRNIVWVADEPAQGHPYSASNLIDNPEVLTAHQNEVQESGIAVHGIVETRINCTNEDRFMGMNAAGHVYSIDSQGALSTCEIEQSLEEMFDPSNNSNFYYAKPYVETALISGGSVWDWNFVQDGSSQDREVLFGALVKELYENVIHHEGPYEQFDLAIESVFITETEQTTALQISVANRGLAVSPDHVDIQVVSIEDESVIVTGSLSGSLQPVDTQMLELPLPIGVAPEVVRVEIIHSDVNECDEANNTLILPIARVIVTDEHNAVDQQYISVVSQDVNEMPILSVADNYTFAINQTTDVIVEIDDADVGDAHIIEAELDLPFELDPLNGKMKITPPPNSQGTWPLTLSVRDLSGEVQTLVTDIVVNGMYELPVMELVPSDSPWVRVIPGRDNSIPLNLTFDDSADIDYTLLEFPEGLIFNEENHELYWDLSDVTTPDYSRVHLVTLAVTDQYGHSEFFSFGVLLDTENVAPSIVSQPPIAAIMDNRLSYEFTAEDGNFNDLLSWSAHADTLDFELNLQGEFARTGYLYSTKIPDDVNHYEARRPIHADYMPGEVDAPSLAAKQVKLDRNSEPRSYGQYLVGPMRDDNGNGSLDHDDDVLLVYQTISTGTLAAYDLHTRSLAWVYDGIDHYSNYVAPAMADLEGSGQSTVIYLDDNYQLTAVDAYGQFKWKSSETVAPNDYAYTGLVLSDLEQDGKTEILFGNSVFNADGSLKWRFYPVMNFFDKAESGTPHAVDLDGDGVLEVAYLDQVRRADGSLLWFIPGLEGMAVEDSYITSADVTGNGLPELIVLSKYDYSKTVINVVDSQGQLLKSFIDDKSPVNFGPLIVDDFLGDGNQYIFSASDITLFDMDGEIVWRNTDFESSENRRSLIADFDQNGTLEILMTGERHRELLLLSSITGGAVSSFPVGSAHDGVSWGLVNSLGDGVGRIYPGEGVQVIEVTSAYGSPWHSEWASFNHIDQRHGEFGLDQRWQYSSSQVNVHEAAYPKKVIDQLADLHVTYPRGESRLQNGLIDLSVIVSNVSQGSLPSGAKATLYRNIISPDTEVSNLHLAPFAPFEQREVIFSQLNFAELGGQVVVVIEPEQPSEESTRNNNSATGYTAELTTTDMSGEVASQQFTVGLSDMEGSLSVDFPIPGTLVAGEKVTTTFNISSEGKDQHIYAYIVDAPDGVTLDPVNHVLEWTPQANQLGRHRLWIGIYWNDIDSIRSIQRWVNVVESPTNSAPVMVSTPPESTSQNGVLGYRVQSEDPDGDFVTYKLVDGPADAHIHPRTGYLQWGASAGSPGSVTFVVAAEDPYGEAKEQEFAVSVPVTGENNPPQFLSKPSSLAEVDENYTYPVVALDPDGESITLSLENEPEGMVLEGNVVNWTPSQNQQGQQSYSVIAVDGRGGQAVQTVTVYVNNIFGNQAPVITSVPSSQVYLGSSFSYAVAANDSDNDMLVYTMEESPPQASISENIITFTPPSVGTYSFVLYVADGRGGLATQSFSLNVTEQPTGNQPPIWTTSPALGAKVGATYQYTYAANDPDGDALSYSVISAPPGMESEDQTLVWTPTEVGSEKVRLLVYDGSAYTEQIWTVVVVDQSVPLTLDMTVSPGYVDQGEFVNVRLLASGGSSELQATLMVNGSPVAVSSALTATIPASTLGLHSLDATVTDGVSSASVTGEFFVRDANSAGEKPSAHITKPGDDAVITEPVDVIGSVQGDNVDRWALYYQEKGSSNLILLNEGSDEVNESVLGEFDPTMLINGQYVLVLRAWNTDGTETIATRILAVEGEMKVGHFSVTFEDANIPLTGIPIRVTRTYDSRQAQESLDFGYGWSVDYQNVRVHSSRTVGLGWQFQEEGIGLGTKFCVKPMGNPIITVRLPNGDLEKFKAKASPECTRFIATIDVNLVMEPLEGTHSTLRQTDYGLLRAIGGNLVDIGDLGKPVDPQNFVLTTQDGMEYRINRSFGIKQIQDLSGNTVTYSDEGITHSNGQEILFDRDARGRIVALELPNDTSVNYSYTVDGDLASVTNAAVETTEFDYLSPKNPHYLTDIIDPRGITVARNEYDDEGRLVARIDANGNRIEYEHDVAGRIETIKNRLGHPTIYVYNERGDVTAETNALGQTTDRTYDAFGNMLTERNDDNQTKSWNYDSRGLQISETNELSETTYYFYNDKGEVTRIEENDGTLALTASYDNYINKLRSIEDADGNPTTFQHNTAGELIRVIDAEGNEVAYAYNARGLSLKEEDDGTTVRYQRDSMGNVLTETETVVSDDGSTESIVTRFEYDDASRLVKTIDHFDNEDITEYNAAGLVSARIDKLGRRTTYVYSDRGELIETHYPDTTFERTEYDAEGQKVKFIDRLGRETRYEYDMVGQHVKTLHPDNTPEDFTDNPATRSTYDNVGRVDTQYNELNKRLVGYSYDDAGRVISERDTHGSSVYYIYNDKGWRTSIQDPKNKTTHFEHDASGRVTVTRYPDDSSDSITYDMMGREKTRTDQGGKTTTFEYNVDGLLSAVIDHAGNRTEYGYDSRGLKLSQTDAQGQVTRWTYDALGRETSRTLPEGQTETFGYDAVGNRKWHKDFNGDTHYFDYDLNDRLVHAEYADGVVLTFTYDAVGNRLSATVEDALGVSYVTTYTYDARDRLLSEALPNGDTLSYEYELTGARTKLTVTEADGTETVTHYTFDGGERLRSVRTGDGTTRYSYDQNGNLRSVEPPNRTAVEYVYDDLNRLTDIEVINTRTDTAIAGFSYTLDPTGRRTAIEELDGTQYSYGYDDLYRLVSETQTAPDASVLHTASYTYDKVGNRTEQTVNGVTTGFDYNRNDWLLQAGGVHYAYDNNGNTLTETEDGTITASYHYNSQNQMVESVSNGLTTTYGYNADGIRTRKSSNGIDTLFTVDSNRDYAQVVLENSANDKRYYHYGLDLVSQYSAHDGYQYYGYDGLGSTRLLTDEQGAETASYHYDAWGNLLDSIGDIENPYTFAGEQMDEETGLQYLRARYMNPGVGRFTSMDMWMGIDYEPITLNKYLYGPSDPLNFVDPSGNSFLAGSTSSIGAVLTTVAVATPWVVRGASVVKAGALTCLAQAIMSTTGVYSSVFGASGKNRGCEANKTRVQLQIGTENITSEPQIGIPAIGVTVNQVRAGLNRLYLTRNRGSGWPSHLDQWLYRAIVSLSIKLNSIPAAGGISIGGNIMREETFRNGKSHRVDIENLRGHNLRR